MFYLEHPFYILNEGNVVSL